MIHTLIANSGIQLVSMQIEINVQERSSLMFYEKHDEENGKRTLDIVHEIKCDDEVRVYRKSDLLRGGFLAPTESPTFDDIEDENNGGLLPMSIDGEAQGGFDGTFYKFQFTHNNCCIDKYENQWLPLPYFKRRGRTYISGPYNWARMLMTPISKNSSIWKYNVLLAFDTRTNYEETLLDEAPCFIQGEQSMDFGLCSFPDKIMEFCSTKGNAKFVNAYLARISGANHHKKVNKNMSYLATYILLIDYLSSHKLLPEITLYKEAKVICKDIDMIIDIGNSRTTALIVEDNSNFNQVSRVSFIDFTKSIESAQLIANQDSFDMQLVFRNMEFGSITKDISEYRNSKQFVYGSFVRLGQEANYLIHKADENTEENTLSIHSSPKRYLWDNKELSSEWRFITLPEEVDNHVLNINGLSQYIAKDGTIDVKGNEGTSYHYSRKSLMTFAFLEILMQANMYINSHQYRVDRGEKDKPRVIKRLIVTCPTAMSRIEREGLVDCAKDATFLFDKICGKSIEKKSQISIQIYPEVKHGEDAENHWYYDEATCSQLVYMYGEVGYKYKGAVNEFFNLYGKQNGQLLTVGSLDIGAGTSDLMISQYAYETSADNFTTLKPDPIFYDSFYFAGDDMLQTLILSILLQSPNSAFRKKEQEQVYQQKLKDCFGPDYSGQTFAERVLRRDFNIQYLIPVANYFLQLNSSKSDNVVVKYNDIFQQQHPNQRIIDGFKQKFGLDITTLEWQYNQEEISAAIQKAFEPLLQQIATIMYNHGCDIILLSGRPASLPAVRNIFLKYYPTSPNRIILLNDYYVGHWFPFGGNTGYIKESKTIVAMGAVIAHYASEASNLYDFHIDTQKLDKLLESTVHYVESPQPPYSHVLTPEESTCEIKVAMLPCQLKIKQVDFKTYPSRTLYNIDFNTKILERKIRNRADALDEDISDKDVQYRLHNELLKLQARLPYTLKIERNPEDVEELNIVQVLDKNGEDTITPNSLSINIQSMGIDGQYWLDSGIFKI